MAIPRHLSSPVISSRGSWYGNWVSKKKKKGISFNFVLWIAAANAAFINSQSSLSEDSQHSFNDSRPNQIFPNGNIQCASNSPKPNHTSLKGNKRNSSSLYDPKDFVDFNKCEL